MSTKTIKCPNCGGPLHFEPNIQKNKCDYCLSEFTNEELRVLTKGEFEETEHDHEHQHDHYHEHTEEFETEQSAFEEHLSEYTCNSCGANVVTEETTSTTFCYYCHNPVILTDRISGEFRPDKVIPFTFSKEKALSNFMNWSKKFKYVPKEFYSKSQLEKMTGLYVPNWMAETDAQVDYQGTGTTVRVWRVGDTEYTEYKKFDISRQGDIKVENITEIALKKIDHDLLNTITPYDQSKAVDFDVSYLNGFFSEKYDIKSDDLKKTVEDRAEIYTNNLLRDTVSRYRSVDIKKSEVNAKINRWTYILLPVWILTYNFGGKTYIYAVNGQTGKSFGELPLDYKKLSINAIAIFAAVLAVLLIGGLLIW